MNPNISRVSSEEIRLAQQTTQTNNATHSSRNENGQSTNTPLLSKLKDQEIIDFFSSLGYLGHTRQKNAFGTNQDAIIVYCDDFEVAFTDYDIIVNCNVQTSFNDKKSFDMKAFRNYCEAIDTTPEKALSDLIQIKFLGQRFHKFGRNYAKQKNKQRKEAFSALPKNMQKQFAVIDQKREHEIDGIENMLAFGTFSQNSQNNI